MARKFGDEFVSDMIDRGRRELGAIFYIDSNIAQPMYPLRGSYGMPKAPEPKVLDERESDFEKLHPVGVSHDDLDRDDRDKGMDRE